MVEPKKVHKIQKDPVGSAQYDVRGMPVEYTLTITNYDDYLVGILYYKGQPVSSTASKERGNLHEWAPKAAEHHQRVREAAATRRLIRKAREK